MPHHLAAIVVGLIAALLLGVRLALDGLFPRCRECGRRTSYGRTTHPHCWTFTAYEARTMRGPEDAQ